MMRRIVFEVAVIVCLSMMFALGSSLLRPEALSWIARERPREDVVPADAGYGLVVLNRASQLHAQSAAVFADARSTAAYAEGHIAGAIHLDPHEFDAWSARVIAQYGIDQVIITYCDGAQCPLARELAEKLTWLGFEQVFYLPDGWGQWQAAGLPVETRTDSP